MSKKTVGTIISSVSFLIYVLLAVVQYRSYIGVFQGRTTLGSYVALQSMIQSYAAWLIQIAAFFPLLVFFRHTIHWNRGAKCCMLIAAIVVPSILSSIGTPFYSQSLNAISNGQIMTGAFWISILLNVISRAISTIIWVAAANGIGLLGKSDYQHKMSSDSAPTESNSSYSYLEQYKQRKNNGGI